LLGKNKAEVLNFKPGAPMRRKAFVVVYERANNKTFEAVVDLKNRSLQSWKEIPGAQPTYMAEDIALSQSIVTSDPQSQAAMRRRGITEFDKVQVDPWPAGYFGFPDEEGVRVHRAGFKVMPSGFFARNPALDVPKPEAAEKATTR